MKEIRKKSWNILHDYDVEVLVKELSNNNDNSTFKLYSVKLLGKDVENNWINAYMPARFKKGTEFNQGQKIKIIEAWLQPIKVKGVPVTGVFINEFNILEDLDEDNTDLETKKSEKADKTIAEDISEPLPF